MITTVDRQYALETYPCFPIRTYDPATDEETCYFPEAVTNDVLRVAPDEGIGSYDAVIAPTAGLLAAMKMTTLIFLGDTDQPWLRHAGANYRLKPARNFLNAHGIDRSFNGAVIVRAEMLPAFLTHLLALTRANAAMPYVYFTGQRQNLLMSLCHHAHLHIHALDKQSADRLYHLLPGTGLERLPDTSH